MELIGVHPIKQSDLGFNNTLFGGQLLHWLDSDAYAYASEVCDTPRVVTSTLDRCVFKLKIKPNHFIKIYADVKSFGRTSVTITIEARRHNVYNGKQEVALSTEMKFVRVDEDGYPLEITERVKKKYKKENGGNKGIS